MSDSTQNPPPEGNQAPPPPPVGGTPPPAGPGPGAQQPAPPPPPMGQPGYGPGYGAPPSNAGRPADLLIRFLARLIDGILVGIVNGILTGIIVVGMMDSSSSYGFAGTDNYAASAVSAIISAALYLGYFTLMEARTGQTLGKMLLKLRTQGPGGGLPTTEQALKRNAWSGLGILGVIPVLGFIGGLAELVIVIGIAVTIHNSPSKQGWHDTFAGGTQVVRTG